MVFGHESSESRRARVALQLRDRHGKWIEMGGGIKWFHGGSWHHGTVDSFKGTNVGVKMDDGSQQFVSHTLVEPIHAKATLPSARPAVSTVHSAGAVNGNGNNVIKIKDNVAGQRLTTGVKELQVGDRVYAINHSNGTTYNNNSSNPFSVNNGIASQLENTGFEVQTNQSDHSPIYGVVKSITPNKFAIIDTGNNKTVALGWNHQVIADYKEVEDALHEAQATLNTHDAAAKAALTQHAAQITKAPAAPSVPAKYADHNQEGAYNELRNLGFSDADASNIVEAKDPAQMDTLFTGSPLGKSLEADHSTSQYVDFPTDAQKAKWGSYTRATNYLNKVKADLTGNQDSSTNTTVPGTMNIPPVTPALLAKKYDDLTPAEKMAWDNHFQYLGGNPAKAATNTTSLIDHADALPDGTILRDGSKVSNAPGSTMFKDKGKWYTPGQPPQEIDPKTFASNAHVDTLPLLDDALFSDPKGVTLQKNDIVQAHGKQYIVTGTDAKGDHNVVQTGIINGRRGPVSGTLKESDISGVHQWSVDNTNAPSNAPGVMDIPDPTAPTTPTPTAPSPTTVYIPDPTAATVPAAPAAQAVHPDDAPNIVEGDNGSYSFTSKNDGTPTTAVADMVKAYNTQEFAPLHEGEYHAGDGYTVGFVDKQDTDAPIFAVYDQSGNVVAKHIIDMAYGPATSVEKSIAKDIADDKAAKSGVSAPAAPSAPVSAPASKSFTPVSGFSVGDRVTHSKHGVGTVQKLESNGQYARVNFDQYGDPKKNHGISLTKLSHHTAPAQPVATQAPAAPAVPNVPNAPAAPTPTVTSRVIPPAGSPISVPGKNATQAEKTAFAALMNDEMDNHMLPENTAELNKIQSNIMHYEGEAAQAEDDGDYASANKNEGLADKEHDKLSALVVKNYNARNANSQSSATVAPVQTTPAPIQVPKTPAPVAVNTPAPTSVAPSVADDTAATKSANKPIDISKWTKQSGTQMGSNPGGIYTDPAGKKWYVKISKSDEHAQSEVLADQLYTDAGIPSAGLKLADVGNGKLGTASPMLDGAKADLSSHLKDKAYVDKVQEGFAVDAWLANWDVTGTAYDNIVTDKNGNPVRIDPGGALQHRAQGAPKGAAFGNKANEWDTLRTQPGSATKAFFGGITNQQLIDSASKVSAFSDKQIDDRVDSLGFKKATADMLKERLKARRDDITKRADDLKKQTPSVTTTVTPAAPAPTPAATVTPAATPKPTIPTPVGVADANTAIDDLMRAEQDGNTADGAHYPAGNGYTVAFKDMNRKIPTYELFDPQGNVVATHYYDVSTPLFTSQSKIYLKNKITADIQSHTPVSNPGLPAPTTTTAPGPNITTPLPTPASIATAHTAIDDLVAAEKASDFSSTKRYPAGKGYTVGFTPTQTQDDASFYLYDPNGNQIGQSRYLDTGSYLSSTKSMLQTSVDSHAANAAKASAPTPLSTPPVSAPTVSPTSTVGPWKVGDRVSHPKHGLGTVKKLESNGQYARVNFDQYNDPNKHHGIALSKLSMAPAPTPAGVTPNPVATPSVPTKAGVQIDPQGKPYIPGKGTDKLYIGANVHHARFGDGVVTSLEKNGTHARIRFNNDPTKIKGVKGTMLSNSTTLHTSSTSPTNIPSQNNTGDPIHQGTDISADANLLNTLAGSHSRSATKGDGQLFKAYQAQGFDKALPHKVDDAEFATRKAAGWTTLYRGLASYGTSVNVQSMVDGFYEGDHYAGFGIYGNGSYSTPDKSVAAGYSGGRGGHIMEMQMNPAAKTIDYKVLKQMMRTELGTRNSGNTKWKALRDPGVYAAAKGYDVISVPTTENHMRMPYYVILNRSILSYKSKDNAY